MPKFARPTSYNGNQSNKNLTGSTRAANAVEAAAGVSEQLYISPATMSAAVSALDPLVTTGPITAGTTLTATLGDITATNGNLVFGTAGNKIESTSVATTATALDNSFGTVDLIGGTITVTTTAVTSNSIIMLSRVGVVGTGVGLGMITVGTIVDGVSFDINAFDVANNSSLQATDVSTIGWMIIN